MTAKKILILEDDPEFGVLLAEALSREGYDARLFHNSADAFASLASDPCDLMIVDIIIKMPGGSVAQGGVTFIWRAKEWANQQGRALPIIGMSGSFVNRGMENILDVARQIGADEVLEKPFAPKRLNEMIQALLPKAD